jgi:hypothetical protein
MADISIPFSGKAQIRERPFAHGHRHPGSDFCLQAKLTFGLLQCGRPVPKQKSERWGGQELLFSP